jgi:hypothetical protein
MSDRNLVWLKLHIPPKIREFMWLVSKNKILTKQNLVKKGWIGLTNCHFCGLDEDVTHLFLTWPYVRKIWFWMGNC